MSEKIRILGVDPSLRNTGLAIITYNTEKEKFDIPSNCQVLVNPQKYKGKDAIMSMLDLIQTASRQSVYRDVDNVIIESPAIMFNQSWAGGTISSLAHISGGAAALLGLEKTYLFKPSEWNRGKKKEFTHNRTSAIFGDPESWHYKENIKSPKYLEHILDAASMALWFIEQTYIDEGDFEEEEDERE